ncbi:subtilisin-like protease SBT4.3 isoform X2 [Durio zibethinus]|uniref:Subtilisin-like protease SBT4.3 isoform X2 n=1 Tax=Durio zibethinus TaxID=66656 RepID=A0A6P5XUK0_DURZI|nr:subtilisin-like protease SBT4.3 isoform X2 [Durio zibethinus]
MANYRFLLFLDIFLILMVGMSLSIIATNNDRKAYIVYMGSLPVGEYLPTSNHRSILQQVIKDSSTADTLIRSYKRSFNGFVAKLTDEEVKKLASMKEVLSIFPNQILHLHTTRSWDFMGFNNTARRNPTMESNVIIGVIDTGIWPESPSFSDEGFGPAPKKWKGACRGGKNFTCNNKIIGARFYQSSTSSGGSARDEVGHGSHTASTAAGNEVKDVSFFGLAQGTTRGGVPSARIAAYKVCGPDRTCASADILAGFDDAIADGVDILTVSLGGSGSVVFFNDVIAIGSFHAMEKGILTLNSAGNDGAAGVLRVSSVATWMLAVAASTTDRKFIDKVVLGNGETLTGFSVNSFTSKGKKLPIVYGNDVSRNCSELSAGLCLESCVDSHLVKGKITMCDQFVGNFVADDAGAGGSIVLNDQFDNVSFVTPLPAVALNVRNYILVKSYVNSTKNPVAEILSGETIKDLYSPVVAQFSSLGPNFIAPDILKPDITAPGVDILAAYSPIAPPSETSGDKRQLKYSVLSGTSMSCPHVAGVAAYVKTFHSDWSPSAIKSALMTTAWPMDRSKNPSGEISYGSGHVNPVKAIHPGLVYEAFKKDYIKLMCSMGYSPDNIKQVSGDNSSCPKSSENVPPRDLNYPSLTASVPANKSFTVSFHRTVKNVGLANSTYKARVSPNPKFKVEVVPAVLSFKALKEKKSFNVTVSGGGLKEESILSTTLIWSDGTHIVRSPVVVHTYPSIRLNV